MFTIRLAQRVTKKSFLQCLPVAGTSRAVQPSAGCFFSTDEIKPGHGKGKTSTGIVGLPVDPDAVSKIIEKSQAVLDYVAASDIPETAMYRQLVEKTFRYRIKVAKQYPDDPDMVEDLCRCGQVEQLVQQADDEMMCAELYNRERIWERVAEVNTTYESDEGPITFDDDPVDEKSEEVETGESKKEN